jgi:hypothetical protein
MCTTSYNTFHVSSNSRNTFFIITEITTFHQRHQWHTSNLRYQPFSYTFNVRALFSVLRKAETQQSLYVLVQVYRQGEQSRSYSLETL